MSNETPFSSDQAHHDREALKSKIAKFFVELADEYPQLEFDQDEEYVIIRVKGTEREARILRAKYVPQKDASPVPIEAYVRSWCERLTTENK